MSATARRQAPDWFRELGFDTAEPVRRASASLVVFVGIVLLALYLATGEYGNIYGTDPFTNAVHARALAEDQDPILEELDGFVTPEFQRFQHWLVDAPDGVTAQYPPGTAIWAAPFYALSDTSLRSATFTEQGVEDGADFAFDVPSTFAPATFAAALSVAISITVFGLTISPLLSRRATVSSMVAAGLGTGAWSVAADKLWQHGPAMMCISLGTYFASRNRFAASGFAFAAGVLVRPRSAVIAACIGIAIAIRRRSIKEISLLGAVSMLGVVALAVHNSAVFDSYSLAGGYRLTGFNGETTNSPLVVAGRLAGSLVHERVGIAWSSPFVIVALYAAVKTRRGTPDWALGAAIGGVLYLVIQFRTNRLTGGTSFFSYRYPLEALMAAGPLLAFSTWHWVQESPIGKKVLAATIALSIGAHGVASLLTTVQ